MTEPVGNASRSSAPLPGSNSHAARQAAARANTPPEEREKVEKVITGKVIQKKPNVVKRFARGMVADDVTNVGGFVFESVVMPAVRNLVFDIVSQGTHRVLFGTTQAGRRHTMPGYSGPMTNLKTAYNRAGQERSSSSAPRPSDSGSNHNFDELFLPSHADAMEVLENMKERVARYGSASVADLYDYLGLTVGFTEQKYGWTNLDNADVRPTRQGFIFDLPRPQALR